MFDFLKGLFDSNEKQIRKIQPIVDEINSLEEYTSGLSDDELKAKTEEFRKKLGFSDDKISKDADLDAEKQKEELFELMPEVFAVAREAAKRVAQHRHFDVQLMAGYFLADNKVIELFTGEGKTNSAILALYLYALTGNGAHLITVNDYLARRDGEWVGHILSALGITVGIVNGDAQFKFISDEEAIQIKGEEAKKEIEKRRKKAKEVGRLKLDLMDAVNLMEVDKDEAYACDVVYGTNNEFGFDYLRDNMAQKLDSRVQKRLHFAIVDEADSILIDEARTPLIISRPADASNDMYRKFSQVVKQLKLEDDYTIDEKATSVAITDQGIDKVEKALGVSNVYEDSKFAYHLDNALKAKELYKKDDEYIVKDGQIVIVDEFTGRAMPGRRYSEGLHQAIEAKEGVEVKRESRTLATITLQNYFRLYDYLAGMTGTALTEAEEFAKIYGLDVMVVPPNKPVIRDDQTDKVFRTELGKFNAIVEEIKEVNEDTGQPILVGTTSVEKSEYISKLLIKEGVKHSVLNAKHHEEEARIVQNAGEKGAVTIATNMAGRGTDIALGDGVKDVGGLYVIGTERHESRRIDNQLRGRSGRQGDPGKSVFFVSFEDELMRKFGGDSIKNILGRAGMDDEMEVSLGIVGRTIENAQKRVESHNFDIRKRLVDYDDVLNQQREIVYKLRKKVLHKVDEAKEAEFTKARLEEDDLKTAFQAVDENINQIVEEVDGFTLKEDKDFDIAELMPENPLNFDLNIWILKRLFDRVRFLLSAQLSDDMAVDEQEENSVKDQVKAMFTEKLLQAIAKLDGYRGLKELFVEFEKSEDLGEKEDFLLGLAFKSMLLKTNSLDPAAVVEVPKLLILQSIDNYWMEHLDAMGDLREGIGMRSMAQKDPLVEYKNEGFVLFEKTLSEIDSAVINRYFKVKVVVENRSNMENAQATQAKASSQTQSSGSNSKNDGEVTKQTTKVRKYSKVGRNDPCPCGSGKKYKKCHIDQAPKSMKEREAFRLYDEDFEAWEEKFGKKA